MDKKPIGVLSYGMGNILSIVKIVDRVGATPMIIDTKSKLHDVDKIIIPGVGHFDQGIKLLRQNDLASPLIDLVNTNCLSLLGICLGMQMLCKNSEEGLSDGLALIDANVRKIYPSDSRKHKVPHMGWNYVKPSRPNILLPPDIGTQKFYFVHSYFVEPTWPEITTGLCNYDINFCASFEHNNIFGVQFHPEKSHRYGMALIQRFVEA